MTTQQAKNTIILQVSELMPLKEFNSHCVNSPSLVSLVTRLRKFTTHKAIANKLDSLHQDANFDLINAVILFYSL